MDSLTPAEFAARLGLRSDAGGLPEVAGVARLLRQALARWGLTRAATLNRHVCHTLVGCGYEGDGAKLRVREVLDILCALGDAEVVWVGDEREPRAYRQDGDGAPSLEGRFIAPTLARAIDFGGRLLVVGSREVVQPDLIHRIEERGGARWLDHDFEEQLEGEGFDIVSAERWLGASGILDHLERRECHSRGIAALWPSLQAAVTRFGGPMDLTSNLSVLTGAPGTFWGSPLERTGRWGSIERVVDGTFLGVMLGHHGGRMQPVVGEVHGGTVRVLELFDHEELRWAVLSRGAYEGAPEQVRLHEGCLSFSCPLPEEARRLRALCEVERWNWSIHPSIDINNFGRIVCDRFALSLE